MGAFVCGVTELHVCVHRNWGMRVGEDRCQFLGREWAVNTDGEKRHCVCRERRYRKRWVWVCVWRETGV